VIDQLATDLVAALGEDRVITDRGALAGLETDWTGRFRGRARLAVRPASVGEVAAALRVCAAHRVAVVPQGGNTGLVGGAVPLDAVVLSTTRLTDLGAVDELAGEVTVGAGATLEAVRRHAAAAGLAPAVDLASRGSATIGGMIATDAGGIHALRHGSMRHQVRGIEAVLADGTIVGGSTGLATDRPGLHLPSVLAGSEGTLAVITRARLRLIPVWPERATALAAFGDLASAVAAARRLRDRLPDLDAVEYLDAAALALGAARAGQGDPFGRPAAGVGRGVASLLVETAARRSTLEELGAALGSLPGLLDATVVDDGPGRRRLWAIREGVTEAIAALGVPHKLDVAVPPAGLAAFVAALEPVVARAAPDARTFVFGHLALGNLHVNVLGPAPDDDRVDDAVLRLILEHGGSIAAEHGIGRAKARWLALAETPAETAVRAAIRAALDPHGLLNPGVLAP
jgi:FAD/FMN-containing dehydrogenase